MTVLGALAQVGRNTVFGDVVSRGGQGSVTSFEGLRWTKIGENAGGCFGQSSWPVGEWRGIGGFSGPHLCADPILEAERTGE